VRVYPLEACKSLIAHLVVLPSPQGFDGRGPVETHPDDSLQDFGVNLHRTSLHDYTAYLHTVEGRMDTSSTFRGTLWTSSGLEYVHLGRTPSDSPE
jgi:hypothetical protein